MFIAASQGLAALAAFNIARGDEQSVEEAVDLLNEACATTKGPDEKETELAEEDASLDVEAGGDGDAAAASAVQLAHASVLCTSAQGELILGRGTATASDRLGEALRIREKLLPAGHPATVRVSNMFISTPFMVGSVRQRQVQCDVTPSVQTTRVEDPILFHDFEVCLLLL